MACLLWGGCRYVGGGGEGVLCAMKRSETVDITVQQTAAAIHRGGGGVGVGVCVCFGGGLESVLVLVLLVLVVVMMAPARAVVLGLALARPLSLMTVGR